MPLSDDDGGYDRLMRKLLAWVAGALGLVALWRALRRHEAAEAPAGPDPAEELRRTLAERRAAEEPAPVTPPPTPDPERPSLDERRRRVHERAQKAIDAMRETE